MEMQGGTKGLGNAEKNRIVTARSALCEPAPVRLKPGKQSRSYQVDEQRDCGVQFLWQVRTFSAACSPRS